MNVTYGQDIDNLCEKRDIALREPWFGLHENAVKILRIFVKKKFLGLHPAFR